MTLRLEKRRGLRKLKIPSFKVISKEHKELKNGNPGGIAKGKDDQMIS